VIDFRLIDDRSPGPSRTLPVGTDPTRFHSLNGLVDKIFEVLSLTAPTHASEKLRRQLWLREFYPSTYEGYATGLSEPWFLRGC